MLKIAQKGFLINLKKDVGKEEHEVDENGELATFLSRKMPLTDEDGEVIGLLGISIKGEKSFDLEKLIVSMPGNIFWEDKDGRYLRCNDNVAKILKLNFRYDIIGKFEFDITGNPATYLSRKIPLIDDKGVMSGSY